MTFVAYVARHGETDWNRAGRYQGQRESHLTALGVRQARALAAELADCGATRVIASPLERCVQTATPLAERLHVAVDVDARLLDIAHGTWEGRLKSDLAREDSATVRAWRDEPDAVGFDGGERLADVERRWRDFTASLRPSGDVVVLTHDEVLRLAILGACGRPRSELWQPRVVNAGYARFAVNGATWTLLEECHDAHLAGIESDASRQAL